MSAESMDGEIDMGENNTALAVRQESAIQVHWSNDREKLDLLKKTVAIGTTDSQFALFVAVCQRTGLDPFSRQIYAVMREDKKNGPKMTIQTGIDGFRLIAQRTGEYAGQTVPEWCDWDGKWHEVWLFDGPPAAARIGVYRKGFQFPVYGVCTYNSYCQKDYNGNPVNMWKKMPDVMLVKCSESNALRKAFPQELSTLYTSDEMGQASNGDAIPVEDTPVSRDMGYSQIASRNTVSTQNQNVIDAEVEPEITPEELEKRDRISAMKSFINDAEEYHGIVLGKGANTVKPAAELANAVLMRDPKTWPVTAEEWRTAARDLGEHLEHQKAKVIEKAKDTKSEPVTRVKHDTGNAGPLEASLNAVAAESPIERMRVGEPLSAAMDDYGRDEDENDPFAEEMNLG